MSDVCSNCGDGLASICPTCDHFEKKKENDELRAERDALQYRLRTAANQAWIFAGKLRYTQSRCFPK